MSKDVDVNKSFAAIAVFVLGGGLISAMTGGGGTAIFGAVAMVYFMVVATNAVSRGENRSKRSKN